MSIHFDNFSIVLWFFTNSTSKTIISCFNSINCSFPVIFECLYISLSPLVHWDKRHTAVNMPLPTHLGYIAQGLYGKRIYNPLYMSPDSHLKLWTKMNQSHQTILICFRLAVLILTTEKWCLRATCFQWCPTTLSQFWITMYR